MSKIFEIGITKINNQKIHYTSEIKVLAGKGIEGDRHFNENNNVESQITLIESENIDYYNKTFHTDFDYLDFRRNIVTKNICLNDLVGKTIIVGEIKLKVNDLCRPCKNLQNRLGKDNIIKEFLRKGGLRCEILTSADVKVDDEIKVL